MFKRNIQMLEQCEIEHNFILSTNNKLICTICLHTDHLDNLDVFIQNELINQVNTILRD